jgi:hypothetical protein
MIVRSLVIVDILSSAGVTSRATSEKRKTALMFTMHTGAFFFVSEKDSGKSLEVV